MEKIENQKIKIRSFEEFLKEQYPTKQSRAKADARFHRLALGYEIFLTRKRKGLTQTKLAKKVHTKQSVIARIENGDQNITTDKLNEIAQALNKKLKISLK